MLFEKAGVILHLTAGFSGFFFAKPITISEFLRGFVLANIDGLSKC